MGNTGNSTGTHLHLECSTTESWICSNFRDPCQPLGFANVRGTIVHYGGSPTPPTPTPTKLQGQFPWQIIARKKLNLPHLHLK